MTSITTDSSQRGQIPSSYVENEEEVIEINSDQQRRTTTSFENNDSENLIPQGYINVALYVARAYENGMNDLVTYVEERLDKLSMHIKEDREERERIMKEREELLLKHYDALNKIIQDATEQRFGFRFLYQIEMQYIRPPAHMLFTGIKQVAIAGHERMLRLFSSSWLINAPQLRGNNSDNVDIDQVGAFRNETEHAEQGIDGNTMTPTGNDGNGKMERFLKAVVVIGGCTTLAVFFCRVFGLQDMALIQQPLSLLNGEIMTYPKPKVVQITAQILTTNGQELPLT